MKAHSVVVLQLGGGVLVAAISTGTTLVTSTTSSVTTQLAEITGSPYIPASQTFSNGSGNSNASPTDNVAVTSALSTGVPPDYLGPICNIPGDDWKYPAIRQFVFQGAKYLSSRPDDPNGGPALCKGKPGPEGKGRCQRVSCEHSAAIFVCDDLDHEVDVYCKDVGAMAWEIAEDCDNGSNMEHDVQGQYFGPEGSGWNVIVARDRC